jgi:hypothetical protein
MIAQQAAPWRLPTGDWTTRGQLASFGVIGAINSCVDLAVFKFAILRRSMSAPLVRWRGLSWRPTCVSGVAEPGLRP